LFRRPAKSAKLYQKVWTDAGSPLMVYSAKQSEALKQRVQQIYQQPVVVEIGMRYGNPSIRAALNKLRTENARRIVVLPLYPQYSCSTTASTFDEIASILKDWRWIPEFRFINQYHADDGYIAALSNSILDAWEEKGQSEMLIFSFHGTPRRFLTTGDPYHCMCQATARLVAEKLGLVENRWQVTFQSIFGREEWLQPYTINTLKTLGQSGIGSVDVVCPGFAADCLETIEEIDQENRMAFLDAGGKHYQYIPALNDRPDHIEALLNIIADNAVGWLDHQKDWPKMNHEKLNIEREQRAKALGSKK
ncbi:MAG: ferrochelatase, partial [Thiohalomonadales bacterium]